MKRVMSMLVMCGAMLMMAMPAAAQEQVVTGPPPELRKNLDAFLKAFNTGTPEEFEAMAKATFAPAYFKSQSAEERRKQHTTLKEQFGTIAFQRVQRDGPEEPLVITVKGSKIMGTWWIEIDEQHRVAGLKARAGEGN